MLKKRFKNSLYFLLNEYVVFFVCLFVLWQAISFFRNPVDYKDQLVKINMMFDGIEYDKKQGLEYAMLNHCDSSIADCSCRILIHGIGDNFQNWSKVLKLIHDKKLPGRWVAINYPGTGESDPFAHNEDYQVKRFASQLNQKMKSICDGPYDIVANSMGTWISFWWAIQYPEDVRSLFQLNAVGIYSDYSWFANVMVNPNLQDLKKLHRLGYHNVVQYPDMIYENTIRNMIKRGNKRFILEQSKDLAVDKHLPSLTTKTFIGWGESDRVLPKDTYYQYLDNIPNSRGQLFKNCGHTPNSECPEQVVTALEDFYFGPLSQNVVTKASRTDNDLSVYVYSSIKEVSFNLYGLIKKYVYPYINEFTGS